MTGAAGTPRWFSKHLKYSSRGNTVVFIFPVEVASLVLHKRSTEKKRKRNKWKRKHMKVIRCTITRVRGWFWTTPPTNNAWINKIKKLHELAHDEDHQSIFPHPAGHELFQFYVVIVISRSTDAPCKTCLNAYDAHIPTRGTGIRHASFKILGYRYGYNFSATVKFGSDPILIWVKLENLAGAHFIFKWNLV